MTRLPDVARSLIRRLPPGPWTILWPLIVPGARKVVTQTMQELFVYLLAQAVRALRGTPQYQAFIQNAAAEIKAVIPGKAIEPEIGALFIDLGTALQKNGA